MPEQTTAPAPDLTATERAIDTMDARRAAATCPLTGDEWLLLAEVERLQGVIAKQAADKDELRAACIEFETKVGICESQLHAVDQRWGAAAAAIHDWELGHLDPDTAIRQVRDAMGPVIA